MDYEEIHKYLNEYSPEGMQFNYPDVRDYWCAEYNDKTVWTYIPQDITVEVLDNAIKNSLEYFNIKIDPPVDGVNVV